MDRPVALITGGGSGIGREVALQLAAEGFCPLLTGRREEPLLETGAMVTSATGLERGMGWDAIPSDIADPAVPASLIDQISANFGRLDAIINNAGMAPLTPIAHHDVAEVERVFRVNAIGPIALVAAAWELLLAAPSPVVVGVSSQATFDPFPGLGVYGAAKAGINLLAKAIDNESEVIRSYAVAPGAVETGMLRSIFAEDILPSENTLDPKDVARVIVDCVMGRREEPNGSTIQLPSPS